MDGTAVIVTGGLLAANNAKTAHGLLRESKRFEPVGIVDALHAGGSVAEIVPGAVHTPPIYPSLAAFIEAEPRGADYCILGVATPGGVLPDELRAQAHEAIGLGMHVVNGLHDFLSDDPDLAKKALEADVQLIDVRRPKPFKELRFWSGAIFEVGCPRIAVLGTDCAVGKRTTCVLLKEALEARGIRAAMVYTGQTGWMQGHPHGTILDALPNDFVSGELEGAIVACWKDLQPDVILIEGQSALRNPSGPCGAELLLSCMARHAVLQCVPGRTYYKALREFEWPIPPPEDEAALLRAYGAELLALTLNPEGLAPAEAEAWKAEQTVGCGVPAVDPLQDGVEAVAGRIGAVLEEAAVP